MLPTLAPGPFHHAGWLYEEKVDGWQIVAHRMRASTTEKLRTVDLSTPTVYRRGQP